MSWARVCAAVSEPGRSFKEVHALGPRFERQNKLDVPLLPSVSELRTEIPSYGDRTKEVAVAPPVTGDRELTLIAEENAKRAGVRRIAVPAFTVVASVPALIAALGGAMDRLAVVPVGVASVAMFAVVLPLKFIVSTISETGFDVLPTRALPLSTRLGRRRV